MMAGVSNQRILQLASNADSLILDSFAGSGTTAHAVLKQNAEDGGKCAFAWLDQAGIWLPILDAAKRCGRA